MPLLELTPKRKSDYLFWCQEKIKLLEYLKISYIIMLKEMRELKMGEKYLSNELKKNLDRLCNVMRFITLQISTEFRSCPDFVRFIERKYFSDLPYINSEKFFKKYYI